ncbi:hypothetical protein EMEDMD4_150100 [Sinorhizobium medicae]|uniref:Uncharacterized protein n=1 Tax=Sinorhizobium medicae TaxID=110321 RepID=A0A508WXF4_9HYPH|nr:hypothetical protein EMEDMD4_150100 [Sinorhizobium medicae]
MAEPCPAHGPFERQNKKVEQLLGKIEADKEGAKEGTYRPHQTCAQLDQVLHKRLRPVLDLAAHASPFLRETARVFALLTGDASLGALRAGDFFGPASPAASAAAEARGFFNGAADFFDAVLGLAAAFGSLAFEASAARSICLDAELTAAAVTLSVPFAAVSPTASVLAGSTNGSGAGGSDALSGVVAF